MKFLFYLFSILTITSCSENKNKLNSNNEKPLELSEIEFYNKINKQFTLIDSLRFDISDTVVVLNKQLIDTLLKYKQSIFNLKDTINYNLFYVAKSKNKKMCFVSWDTRQGGTNIDFATILFYKTDKGIKAKYLIDSTQNNTQIHFNEIFELTDKEKTIYLARGFGQGSTALPWEETIAISIINDTIQEENIFPDFEDRDTLYPNTLSKSNYSNSIFIEFDTHNCDKEEPCPVCIFSKDIKTIKIPKTNDKGGHTNKFYTIKYNGTKFELKNNGS